MWLLFVRFRGRGKAANRGTAQRWRRWRRWCQLGLRCECILAASDASACAFGCPCHSGGGARHRRGPGSVGCACIILGLGRAGLLGTTAPAAARAHRHSHRHHHLRCHRRLLRRLWCPSRRPALRHPPSVHPGRPGRCPGRCTGGRERQAASWQRCFQSEWIGERRRRWRRFLLVPPVTAACRPNAPSRGLPTEQRRWQVGQRRRRGRQGAVVPCGAL